MTETKTSERSGAGARVASLVMRYRYQNGGLLSLRKFAQWMSEALDTDWQFVSPSHETYRSWLIGKYMPDWSTDFQRALDYSSPDSEQHKFWLELQSLIRQIDSTHTNTQIK